MIMARRRRHHRHEHEHEHQHKKAHKNVLPTIEPAPGAGGTTTNTTSSPGDSGGVTAAAGDLTGATTTAPVPQQESMDEIQAFFSTGTGPAYHYHQETQQAESAEVQRAGAKQ